MRGLGVELGAPVTEADALALATSVPNWPAFPDSAQALARLAVHYRLIILSNVDRELLRRIEPPADSASPSPAS
jgi:FMN phosphatase YigB (HAD superfamily)